MTSQRPDPGLIEQYTQGECHIFAAASVIRHGGSFLAAFDSDKVHWEADEDTIYEVLHVFAVHDTPTGQVIRDVYGDRFAPSLEQIREELSDEHALWAGDIYLEEMTAAELLALIGDPEGFLGAALQAEAGYAIMDHDDRPLVEVTERDLDDAMNLAQVRAAPGSRPAPDLETSQDYETTSTGPGL